MRIFAGLKGASTQKIHSRPKSIYMCSCLLNSHRFPIMEGDSHQPTAFCVIPIIASRIEVGSPFILSHTTFDPDILKVHEPAGPKEPPEYEPAGPKEPPESASQLFFLIIAFIHWLIETDLKVKFVSDSKCCKQK